MSNQFYKIQVKDIVKTTPECSLVEFDIPKDLHSVFQYTAGQHLTLKAFIDGEETRRSYSLCTCPEEGRWMVAVKKIEGGKFSGWVNDILKAGEYMELMPPHGKFFNVLDVQSGKQYAAFAAGSGITPILSILKNKLQTEPESRFTLFYVNQTALSIILREEIEALKNVYLGRLEVYYFLTQEDRDVPLFNGRITNEKLEILSKHLFDPINTDAFLICGPEEMIFNIKDFLTAKGVPENKIHFELFTTAGVTTSAKSKKVYTTTGDQARITIIEGGKSFRFSMKQGSNNILDEALLKNADLPYACKGGVCCTCMAKLVEGSVNMEVNYALEKEQLDAGYVLTCQAIPVSDNIVIDFDQ